VLKDFLEGRLVSLFEGEDVLAVGLCEEGHIFYLTPTFKVFVSSQSLDTVRVFREVTIV
jgi:hypothetical protein